MHDADAELAGRVSMCVAVRVPAWASGGVVRAARGWAWGVWASRHVARVWASRNVAKAWASRNVARAWATVDAGGQRDAGTVVANQIEALTDAGK